ncbi:MAG: hypothetical protein HOD35_01605 [Euryarchaeota archaeon]|jgi:hypothetical protein|nr:hypothetical protein [Euryarchaeota archaeon]MBT4802036.1 hypothetical protein [Euryarchaeota archaeon]MBT6683281.1 hypothetical protein [Euryarchaeota archaeon]MBT7413971.1 hypothetical protein [Euryarchaeota archaeon]
MEDAMPTISKDTIVGNEVRQSEIRLDYKLSEINDNFFILDEIRRGLIFQAAIISKNWGLKELTIVILGLTAFIMGSWDLGIGELSQGGDYNRVGIFGDNSGFLQISDLTLILSLLSLICWAGIIISLWSEYPIMRENLIYLLIGSFAVQYGYMNTHALNPYFPFELQFSDLGGIIIGNVILLFLAIIVVHRAVRETRDIHVQERHAHPDPRVVKKFWEDHSLKAWDLEMSIFIIVINIMAWAGSHSVASRMNLESENLNYLLILLYIISGIISILMLLVIIWFPHFMLGGAEERIQSVRAREVAGENIELQPIISQGLCPICDVETAAKKFSSGIIEVPCQEIDCDGKGRMGNQCEKCKVKLPTRLKCRSCNSNTPIDSHFGNEEIW